MRRLKHFSRCRYCFHAVCTDVQNGVAVPSELRDPECVACIWTNRERIKQTRTTAPAEVLAKRLTAASVRLSTDTRKSCRLIEDADVEPAIAINNDRDSRRAPDSVVYRGEYFKIF
jgi:hypothetical protein